MTDPALRRLDALERQHAGMLKQRLMDRDRIAALEVRCDKLEAAALAIYREMREVRASPWDGTVPKGMIPDYDGDGYLIGWHEPTAAESTIPA